LCSLVIKYFGEAVLRSSPAAPAWEQLPLSYATNQIIAAAAVGQDEDGVREMQAVEAITILSIDIE